MLREYTSGDIIHGYFTVENKSTKPIKFDMFYLTLEGTTSSKTQSPFGIQKTTKRILRMVDMAASWSYNHEDVNTGEDLCGFFDSIDKTSFGLPNSRILNPGDKRKKFFTFKIPNQLLDVTCKHGHFSHSLLPPTLGFDRPSSSHPELSTLKFSESLGYGRLSERGSSLWLNDSSSGSLINYSINAMIVGKDVASGRVCLMSEKKYSIRIVPFGFQNNPISREKCLKDLEDFDIEIANRLGMIEKVFF
ncbi:ANL_collapsed_G0048090.mRNA.1.CDS.1 [Saccharomyces cerevisiae]|nr:ANL_collapsed_G0048090.mRNA.1.CDS.1 [Saccharomyces cerevisiae]